MNRLPAARGDAAAATTVARTTMNTRRFIRNSCPVNLLQGRAGRAGRAAGSGGAPAKMKGWRFATSSSSAAVPRDSRRQSQRNSTASTTSSSSRASSSIRFSASRRRWCSSRPPSCWRLAACPSCRPTTSRRARKRCGITARSPTRTTCRSPSTRRGRADLRDRNPFVEGRPARAARAVGRVRHRLLRPPRAPRHSRRGSAARQSLLRRSASSLPPARRHRRRRQFGGRGRAAAVSSGRARDPGPSAADVEAHDAAGPFLEPPISPLD